MMVCVLGEQNATSQAHVQVKCVSENCLWKQLFNTTMVSHPVLELEVLSLFSFRMVRRPKPLCVRDPGSGQHRIWECVCVRMCFVKKGVWSDPNMWSDPRSEGDPGSTVIVHIHTCVTRSHQPTHWISASIHLSVPKTLDVALPERKTHK